MGIPQTHQGEGVYNLVPISFAGIFLSQLEPVFLSSHSFVISLFAVHISVRPTSLI